VPITGREIGGGRRAATVHYQVRRTAMTIVRWDSSRDASALQQREDLSRLQHDTLSRMFEGYYRHPQEDLNRGAWVPVVDIYSNGHDLVLKAELPDMKEEEIDLTIENNTLTLSGEKKLDTEVTEELFHRIERSYGAFARTFTLPPTVDTSKVSAQYKLGVLTVRLPLREDAKPNRIKIAVAA
jgi:HSP20 family protein